MKHTLIVIVLAMTLPPLYSQSHATRAAVEGTIRSVSGEVLIGVNVAIRNRDDGSVRSLRTDRSGRYRAALLPLGNYEITMESEGYAVLRQSGVTFGLGQTLTLNFTLSPAVATQPVSLVIKPPLIEPDRKQPSTAMNRSFVSNLPLYGRKFMDLGIMVPGATEFGDRDTSATGDFAGVNHFYSDGLVDGMDAYQAWSNLPKGKFLVPFEFSDNAIREFQVLNGNFNAEFGRSAGGLVIAVTKSGTNQWHGDGYYLFSDSAMNATPRFAFKKPDTSQHQLAGSAGGPLVRDRFFVFGNYDQLIHSEPLIVTSGTALNDYDSTLASITNPDERQRYIQAGDYIRSLTGDFARDLGQYTTLGRADWKANSTHSLSMRFNYQHLRATNVPENGFNTPIITGMALSNNGLVKVGNSSLVLQWTAVLSPRVVNEARMQYVRELEDQISDAAGPQVRIGAPRQGGFAFGRRDVFPASLRERRWEWLDNVTLNAGRHEVKAGVDIHHITDRNFAVTAMSGSYQFTNLRDFANLRYQTYTQGFGVPEDTTVSPYYSAFVQDNIRLAPNLSMNAGLRYEYEVLKASSSPNPQFPLTAQVPTDKNNFAPRLALAWQPADKFAVRASYGMYYGPLPIQVDWIAKTQNGVFQNLRVFRGPNTAGAPQYPRVFAEDPNPQLPLPGANITVFSPDFKSAYTQQVNVELEREVTPDLSVSSGWLYTKGTRLRSNVDMNLFPPVTRTVQVRDTTRNVSGTYTMPYFQGATSRPNPFFEQISEFKSDNNSLYNAWYVQLKERGSHGLQFLMNYTLSKLIDRDPAPGNQITCCSSDNPFSTSVDRGLGRRDQRHRLNVAAIWEVPNGSSGGPGGKELLRHWRANTIIKVGSGRPFVPTITGDQGGDLNGDAVRGDSVPIFGRGKFTGPGYATVDLGLHRIFAWEGRSVETGIEAFNLFNHANYLRPATDYFTLTSGSGGVVTLDGPLQAFGRPQDATSSRQIQAVLRVHF